MSILKPAIPRHIETAVFALFSFQSFFLFAQQPKLVLPIGHTSIVVSAEFSSDGKYIVTASWDNTAKIWQAMDGKLLFVLKGHKASVTSATFSPDGKYIVTSSKDNTAKIWDAFDGKLVNDLEGHRDWLNSAAFSPDGKYVVTGSWDSTAKIWDAMNGKLVQDLKGHSGVINFALFSNDGKYVVTASSDSTAKVWDARNGKLLISLKGHTKQINSASFSPDGKYIVTASRDSTAKTWDAADGRLVFDLKGHAGEINAALFSNNGKWIATGSSDGTAKIWDASDGKLLYDLKGHAGSIKSVMYDRENKYILTSSTDNTAAIWDANNGKRLRELKGHANWVNKAMFSPDGKSIVTASSDNTAKTWRVSNGHRMNDLTGHVAISSSAVFSPDGKYIIAVSSDSSAKIWNSENGRLIKTLAHKINWICMPVFSPDGKYFITASFNNNLEVWSFPDAELRYELKGHTDWICSAQFSSDGKYIASSSWDSTTKIWDIASGKLLHNLHAHTNVVQSVSFSKSGKYLATASWDGTAKIWNFADGRLLHNLKGHRNEVRNAVFSNDEKFIVTSSWDSTAKVWNVAEGKLLRTLKGHHGFVNSGVFSSDGKYILTASMDSTTRIWSVSNGQLLHVLKGHSSAVLSAIYGKDGKNIYTSSWDNTSKIWNATEGNLVHTLEGHTAPLSSISLSTDGKYVVTASEDGMLKKWYARTGELIYSFFAVDSLDYLIVDKDGRYDGTQAARKMLYYVCDEEVVDLEQFKNLSWEPGLAGKLNALNKEPITAKKITDINICNYTPVVEEKGMSDSAYYFQIIPRNGGISEVQLFVNNKLINNYDTLSLQRKGSGYYLSVSKKEAAAYFVSDGDNEVLVKAISANGVMQSRGAEYTSATDNKLRPNPDMYIVAIGISGYKGNSLKLNYASKDAKDFSSAVIASAKKLLNTDGREHVFAYVFNTEANSSRWPVKNEIIKAIDSIAQKAKPDDILIAFFAGHGVLQPAKRDLYMLTAEASDYDVAGIEKQVAISSEELNEWSRKIKASKQVLILDACSSGQVINNLQQQMGRGDVPADEQRALENLKDRTGLFILSASASGQVARESRSYNQGLLTYSLLSGIKLGSGLRDNKFIDVSRWFNFASDDVKKLAREIGVRQDPQILGSTSFDVGIVDRQITDSIKLAVRKNIFRRSRFIQDEELLNDDIDLSGLVDKELNNLSEKGKESPLVFVADNIFADAYSVRGRYSISANVVSVKISLIKGQKEKMYQFAMNGAVDKKEELAFRIVDRLKRYLLFGN